MGIGLFTREDLKQQALGTPKGQSNLSADRLQEIGIKGVERMNPSAKTKHMEPTGSKTPVYYVLGDAPSEEDDEIGKPFTGAMGRMIKNALDGAEIRFDNCCRTLPPGRKVKDKLVRVASPDEWICYRNSVEEDIDESNTPIIIGFGAIPLAWALGKVGTKAGITVCRGRKFPIQIKGKLYWFYSVRHPKEILEAETDQKKQRESKELRAVWNRDMARIVKEAGLEVPTVEDPEHMFDGITCFTEPKLEPILKALKELETEPRIGLDVETNRDRPYRKGAKVLSIAVGTRNKTIAFGIDHPQVGWSKEQRQTLLNALREVLKKVPHKTCHNTPFDLEWLVVKLFGPEIIEYGVWHDTMSMAFVLDEREGGFSLNFLLVQHFGFKLKAQSTRKSTESWMGLMEQTIESNIDRMKLEQTDLGDVLRYNALDTKYTDKLHLREKKLLKSEGRLWSAYKEFVGRVGSIVMAQVEGLPVSQFQVEQDKKLLQDQITPILREIKKDPSVLQYEKRFGQFNPDSATQCITLFKDVLGRKEGIRGKSYSADEETLSSMKDCPVAKLILKLRQPTKLLSTYLETADIRSPGTDVYPDGKFHTRYGHVRTSSGRFSSECPNTQNFPKRKDAWVRRMISAPAGWTMISADYGALEVRGLAMASLDPVLIKYLWTEYDTHLEWAKRIYKAWPKTFNDRWSKLAETDEKAAWKKWRNEVKNEFVFPMFFGSSVKSAARSLDTPDHILEPVSKEFWDEFRIVKKWQQSTLKFYDKYGYVETLTGRRRNGPLSYNQVVNMVIQGSSADLVVNAMNRIRSLAIRTNRPYLAPVLMIHDDLSYFVPKPAYQESLEVIAREMCLIPFEWSRTVPILVEISNAQDWASLKEVGAYRSDRLDQAFPKAA